MNTLSRLPGFRIALFSWIALASSTLAAQDEPLHTFTRQQLTDVYYSEGAHAGDLNQDGHADVVYGPYWFAGPDMTEKHEIYAPVAQDRERYADNFFSWVYDFDGDGWQDVFVVGFPGTPAYVYQNPGKQNTEGHWPKHQVFDWVSNESPHFTDLVGDRRPELVCTRDGFFGFATIDWNKPFDTWQFHAISDKITATRFGHGLGVGDLNGDGRLDVLHSNGWFEQPADGALDQRWLQHEARFTDAYGGAEMYAYDVDGDGDNDVITSLAAHDFGLAWYEQQDVEGKVTFKQHLIMGSHPADNKYGVLFSELHSVNLADIDGDGLKDIVTGKTYYSHHQQSPLWDAGAVVYWFRLVRNEKGVDWIPYRADDDSGIGRQVSLVDVNADGLLDVVVGGMKGAHVLHHKVKQVDKAAWQAAQPRPYDGPPRPSIDGAERRREAAAIIATDSGRANAAWEAESLTVRTSAGTAKTQDMANFSGSRWSGDQQLWWTGGRPGDVLELGFSVDKAGKFDFDVVLTCARDYGIVQLYLDEKKLGAPLDLYEPQVGTTGVLSHPQISLTAGAHQFRVELLGSNLQANPGQMVGIDFLRLSP